MTVGRKAKKFANSEFTIGESVVYPTHGVGRLTAIEEREIMGAKLSLFVVYFEKEKMILRVPTDKATNIGLRKLSEPASVHRVLKILTGPSSTRRTIWSRKAHEYEAKISSPELCAIAEVVRDLYRPTGQPEPSFSEREIYETALDLLVRELGALNNITNTEALKFVEDHLAKSSPWIKDAGAEASST